MSRLFVWRAAQNPNERLERRASVWNSLTTYWRRSLLFMGEHIFGWKS